MSNWHICSQSPEHRTVSGREEQRTAGGRNLSIHTTWLRLIFFFPKVKVGRGGSVCFNDVDKITIAATTRLRRIELKELMMGQRKVRKCFGLQGDYFPRENSLFGFGKLSFFISPGSFLTHLIHPIMPCDDRKAIFRFRGIVWLLARLKVISNGAKISLREQHITTQMDIKCFICIRFVKYTINSQIWSYYSLFICSIFISKVPPDDMCWSGTFAHLNWVQNNFSFD